MANKHLKRFFTMQSLSKCKFKQQGKSIAHLFKWLKPKTLTALNAEEDSYSLLVRIQNASLEGSLTVSYKAKLTMGLP